MLGRNNVLTRFSTQIEMLYNDFTYIGAQESRYSWSASLALGRVLSKYREAFLWLSIDLDSRFPDCPS